MEMGIKINILFATIESTQLYFLVIAKVDFQRRDQAIITKRQIVSDNRLIGNSYFSLYSLFLLVLTGIAKLIQWDLIKVKQIFEAKTYSIVSSGTIGFLLNFFLPSKLIYFFIHSIDLC